MRAGVTAAEVLEAEEMEVQLGVVTEAEGSAAENSEAEGQVGVETVEVTVEVDLEGVATVEDLVGVMVGVVMGQVKREVVDLAVGA